MSGCRKLGRKGHGIPNLEIGDCISINRNKGHGGLLEKQ